MKTTIKQLAEYLEVTPPQANGFVHVLEKLGRAKKIGHAPKEDNKRGKLAIIFDVDEDVLMNK